MPTEIILAHPYSGAMYAYFSDEIGRDLSHTRIAPGHNYYRTLYGNGYRRNLDLALAFLLLYDDVFVAPADNHWPESRLNPTDPKHIAELGLHSDWNYFSSGDYPHRHTYIADIVAQDRVRNVLRNVLRLPEHAWPLIVEYALYEESLSARKRIPILCSPGRRTLINTLVEVQKRSLHPTFVLPGSAEFVEHHVRLTGLALAPTSLEHLLDAKPDPAVRKYGRALVSAVEQSATNPSLSRRQVAVAALEALHTEATTSLFIGLLRWGSIVLRLAHEPVLATAGSAAAGVTAQLLTSPSWCEFRGNIDKAISKADAVRKFRAVAEREDT